MQIKNNLYSSLDIYTDDVNNYVDVTYGLIYDEVKFEFNVRLQQFVNKITTEPNICYPELWLELLNLTWLQELNDYDTLESKDITNFKDECSFGIRYLIAKKDANKEDIFEFCKNSNEIIMDKLKLNTQKIFRDIEVESICKDIEKFSLRYFNSLEDPCPGDRVKKMINESNIYGSITSYKVFNDIVVKQRKIALLHKLGNDLLINDKKKSLNKI